MPLSQKKRKAGVGPSPATLDQVLPSLAGIAEVGFLVAAADGEVAEEELEVIAGVISGALDGQVTAAQLLEILEACDNALENDGWEERVEAATENVQADEARRLALFTAAAVLVADQRFVAGAEDAAYVEIAEALGFGTDEAASMIDEAAAAFA